jgi:NADPH-dependent ferric siderophore reductase
MPEPRQRPPRRNLAVQSVTQITPRLRRIVATGELEEWDPAKPGAHFKVFVPQAGSKELAMRTYTVRDFKPGALTIDFAQHSDGPATSWAQDVKVGAEFEISGMARSGFVPDPASEWCVFLADHAALPAVAAILESLPAALKTLVIIELQAGAAGRKRRDLGRLRGRIDAPDPRAHPERAARRPSLAAHARLLEAGRLQPLRPRHRRRRRGLAIYHDRTDSDEKRIA